MASELGNIVKAQRFNELKQKVKEECKRRKYVGSVEQYGGTNWDFSNVPATDKEITKEHYEKISIPMRKINWQVTPNGPFDRIIKDEDLLSFETNYIAFKGRDIKEMTPIEQSDCSSLCTGTCTNTCTGGCGDSCTGKCKDSCSGGCSGGCSNTCSGSCGGGCMGQCTSCSGGCGSGCIGDCVTSCVDGCDNGCGGVCTKGCGQQCSEASGDACGNNCKTLPSA